MNNEALFLIGDLPGFTPEMGRLVSMMNYVRSTTVSAVKGLRMADLDYQHDSQSNSIGALLLHIAATEVGYQAGTFYARRLTELEEQQWSAAIELGDRARSEIRGRELGFYLSALEQIRATTLSELGRRDDNWLQEQTSFGNGQKVNNHFKWFHVLGHELNHKGQIEWLRKRAAIGAH
ncbi:MAG TPA: DinB family protein [Terriglobia bacterium]|nr:DinB family protein [Terriglobia bacterium]